MSSGSRSADGIAVVGHRFFRDARDTLFSRAVASSFEAFGARSRLSMPIGMRGVGRIAIAGDVYIGPGSWLLTHEPGGRIEIGDGCSIAGYCVLAAAASVSLGREVLFARNVLVADHRHGLSPTVPILCQPLEDVRPVRIEDGAWLGQNVVILPGVTVGANAAVGANSVVRDDVPARSVAVGSPARVVRYRT